MFRLFSSVHKRGPVSALTDGSTSTLSNEIIPGGPSPDSSFSPHDTRHQAVASAPAADADVHPQTSRTSGNVEGSTEGELEVGVVRSLQPSRHVVTARTPTPPRTSLSELFPATTAALDPKPILKKVSEGSTSHSRRRLSDAHPENAPTATAASEGANARRSASVASRRTNRSATVTNASGSAFANGAATAANEPPDLDPSLHARAASAEDDLKPREKAVIRKEERVYFFFSRCYIASSIWGMC
jgi:hypothetical protein